MKKCQLCELHLKRRELFEHMVIQHPRGAIEGMSIAWTFTAGVIFVALGIGGILGIVLQANYSGVRIAFAPNIPFIVSTMSGIGLMVAWTLRLSRLYSTLRIRSPQEPESKDSLEENLRTND